MANCDSVISRDIQANCDNSLIGELENVAYIINRDDIDFDSCVYGTNQFTLTDIVLKAGKTAYLVHQLGDSFSGAGTEMEKKRFKNTWATTFPFIIFDNDPETKENVEGIANGRFVVIWENKYKNTAGTSTFEVVGFKLGLRCETFVSLKYDPDTLGGWVGTLKELAGPSTPITVFKTDEAVTRAMIEALVTA